MVAINLSRWLSKIEKKISFGQSSLLHSRPEEKTICSSFPSEVVLYGTALDCSNQGTNEASIKKTEYGFLEEGFTGDPVVVNHTANGKHRQASVLELLELHVVHLFLGLSDGKTHGVESEVSGLAIGVQEHGFHGDVSLVGPEFQDSHPEDNLHHGGDTNNRRGKVGVIDVLESGKGHVLLCNESNGCKHGRTSMLDLGFPQPLHIDVFGESERVETAITDVSLEVLGSSEVRNGLGHFRVERGRPLSTGILGTKIVENNTSENRFRAMRICIYESVFVIWKEPENERNEQRRTQKLKDNESVS